jgi:lipocalin
MSILTKLFPIAMVIAATMAQQCPPPMFDALDSIDLDGFVDGRWYSIKQIVVPYQPKSQFYCVTAKYAKKTTPSIFCRIFGCKDRPTITVFNSARRRSVTGRVVSIRFEATITDPDNAPAKAQVVPTFFPSFLRSGSNYWIVAAGKWEDLVGVNIPASGRTYDWAIITTGKPDSKGKEGCFSDGGMWLFSKVPNPEDEAVEAIELVATDELGLDTSKWLRVKHDGCTYQ